MSFDPKCYKVRVVSERFIIQSVDVEPRGVTLSMKKERVNENWLPFCERTKVKCKIEVTKVPCSKKGSGKGKIREFTKFKNMK